MPIKWESSTQTVSWLRDLYLRQHLDIRPPYQRKPVWVEKQKCALIETILLKLPVPEIYIQRFTDSDGLTKYAVVDGQQRVRTVIQFAGAETDEGEGEYNEFTLDKLDTGSVFYGLSIKELDDRDRIQFFGYSFAVRFIDTTDDSQVRDIFKRVNKFLTPLNPQELRNSTYTGPFFQLSNLLGDDEYWSVNRLVSPAQIRRMKDIEFVSDLLIGVLHGPQDGKASVIDSYYEKYESFDDEFPKQKAVKRRFLETRYIIETIFPTLREQSRWRNRTDFYTLFVAIATHLRTARFSNRRTAALRRSLKAFAEDVDTRLADERARVSDHVIDYVRAVEKGANGKPRRAERHRIMMELLNTAFTAHK